MIREAQSRTGTAADRARHAGVALLGHAIVLDTALGLLDRTG